MAEENLWQKQFSDTPQGAREALDALSIWDVTDEWTTKIDPFVEGCWMVISPDKEIRNIVYLKGYKDPWGRIREENDFETLE